MRKFLLMFSLLMSCSIMHVFAQSNDAVQQKLFYHSSKGISFIPPLSKPSLVYNGKLYIGKKQLTSLFTQLKDPELWLYFDKYKSNKTTADVLGILGSVALPIANVVVTANEGKINWWLFASAFVVNGASNVFKLQAEKNLLLAAVYYDKKNGLAQTNIWQPQQQSLSIRIPLSTR